MSQELLVEPDDDGKKIENFLKSRFPIGYVRKLFRKNGLRLNGAHPKAQTPVRPGDRIELFIPFESESRHSANLRTKPRKIDILFENAEFLVINKPAGLAVHEATSVLRESTLIAYLESRYREAGCMPLLVHRLDKDTSGVLLAAKNQETQAAIACAFDEGSVAKNYVCLVAGRLPQNRGTVDFHLPGRDGRPVRAVTHYQVEKRFPEATLARVSTETGRMHQIRLHFAMLGYPVVMDNQHGDFTFNKSFRKRFGLKRQFLHAARLSLNYRGKKFTWSAPLPDDLQRTLGALEAGRLSRFKAQNSKFKVRRFD